MAKLRKYIRPLTIMVVLLVIGSLAVSMIACGDDEEDKETGGLPGAGTTVTPARATWDTEWFQIEIYIKALEELGYKVERPSSLNNSTFYPAVAQGDIDFWASGWFPLHNTYMADIEDDASMVGYVAKGGALQGYLIDKATYEEYNITNLEDFKDPEIASLFDMDGNGKADLVACPPGWGCELVIEHHLDAYELRDFVEPIKADYSISMADAVARYEAGESIFWYTWTPNWTVGKLVPGVDVVWLEVPFPSLPEEQADQLDATTMSGVEGCVDDPCEMGWPANDIRVVANDDFLADNPAAEALFESMEIPLEAIFAQNALMFEGENSDADVIRHAEDWIEENQAMFDSWVDTALAVAE